MGQDGISQILQNYNGMVPIYPIKHGPKPLRDVEKLAKKPGVSVVTSETTRD